MIKVKYVGVTVNVNIETKLQLKHNEKTLRSAAFRCVSEQSVSQDLINNSIASTNYEWIVLYCKSHTGSVPKLCELPI